MTGNHCDRDKYGSAYECVDRASSSDWLFGLWPGPPQRFEPTGTDTPYQYVRADGWPWWGGNADLIIGGSGAPGGSGESGGQLFAMKILQKRKVVARNQVEHTRAERNVLERMRDIPFIVGVHFAFQTEEQLFLVLDFVPGGELFFHLKEHGRFAEKAVRTRPDTTASCRLASL